MNEVLHRHPLTAPDEVRRSAHTLSSNLETFGLPDLAALTGQIAKAITEDPEADITKLLEAHRARCESARIVIAEFAARLQQ